MSEYAPLPPKVRVTKAQLRKIQANYEQAQSMAVDFSKKEAKEKKKELSKIEKALEDLL